MLAVTLVADLEGYVAMHGMNLHCRRKKTPQQNEPRPSHRIRNNHSTRVARWARKNDGGPASRPRKRADAQLRRDWLTLGPDAAPWTTA